MLSRTEIQIILTNKFHNGRRIWRTGSTKKLTLWRIRLKSLNQGKILNADNIFNNDTDSTL